MLWKAIREVIRSQVEILAGTAAKRILGPCARLIAWSLIERRARRDVVRRFAAWRVRVLRERCHRIGRGHCDVGALLEGLLGNEKERGARLADLERELEKRGVM